MASRPKGTSNLKLRRLLATVAASCAVWPEIPVAGDTGCWSEPPLLRVQWDSLPLEQSPAVIGEWLLPVSADRPDLMTEARVQMQLLYGGRAGGWRALFHFSFPDPKPYGIPFTFQRAELVWESTTGPVHADLDWSDGCSGPGRGLFPRQSWSAVVDLPSDMNEGVLKAPSLRIWGSRN